VPERVADKGNRRAVDERVARVCVPQPMGRLARLADPHARRLDVATAPHPESVRSATLFADVGDEQYAPKVRGRPERRS